MISPPYILNVCASLAAALAMWIIVLEEPLSTLPPPHPCSFYNCFDNCSFSSEFATSLSDKNTAVFESNSSQIVRSLSFVKGEMILQFERKAESCSLRSSCQRTIFIFSVNDSAVVRLPCKLLCGACAGLPSALSFDCGEMGQDALFWTNDNEKKKTGLKMKIELNTTHFASEDCF